MFRPFSESHQQANHLIYITAYQCLKKYYVHFR